jgi:hypothetical protein
MRIFKTIKYNETDQASYECIELHIEEDKKQEKIMKFNSGNFCKDWYDATFFIINSDVDYCTTSSSVDHFIMDGDNYESTHLKKKEGCTGEEPNGEGWELDYNISFEELDNSVEFFVPIGERPTWQEFKLKYKTI